MKNAVEIEELIENIKTGKEDLSSVIRQYEEIAENADEDLIFSMELKIYSMKSSLSECCDEIDRLLNLLDGDTRKLNKRHSNKILKTARFYL